MSESDSGTEFESADEGDSSQDDQPCQGGDHLTVICDQFSSLLSPEDTDNNLNHDDGIDQQTVSDAPTLEEVLETAVTTVESEKSDETAAVEGWEIDDEDVLDLIDDVSPPDNVISERDVKYDEVPYPETKLLFDRMADHSAESSKSQSSAGWGSSWGNWGSALLSTATASVSTFTSQVGQGLSNVLESTLSAPSPEELAKLSTTEGTQSGDSKPFDGQNSSSSLNSLVSGVSTLTTAIEKTSSKVLSGGLTTLEMLGKKTMDIIQEGDPGLKNKRALIKGKSPNLSEVLKEAKLKSEQTFETYGEERYEKSVCFSSIFDDHQGLIHLEALEMLSSQCEKKVQMAMLAVTGEELEEMQRTLQDIKDAISVDVSDDAEQKDDYNFISSILSAMDQLNLSLKPDKLLKVQERSQTWIESVKGNSEADPKDAHDRAIEYLAEYCAKVIELIHKICELIFLEESRNPELDATLLSNLASVACVDVQLQSSLFTALISDLSGDMKLVSTFVTNIFLEASNCCSCIQDAVQLVVPIFQFKVVAKNNQ